MAMMKKAGIGLFALAIAAAPLALPTEATAVEAESVRVSGYYESMDGEGALALSQPLGGEVTSVAIAGETLSLTPDNVSVEGDTLIFTLPDSSNLLYGNEYLLQVGTSTGRVELPFTYVTKAISTAEDCAVFDIETDTTIVTGYYVLTCDLDIGETLANAHAGTPSLLSTDYGFAGTFDGQGHNITFVTGKYGFFGNILPNALIENVGFVDITYSEGISTQKPILAYSCYLPYSNTARVRNCFFLVGDLPVGGGVLLCDGLSSHNLMTENIVIKYGNLTSRTPLSEIGAGSFIGWDRDWGRSDRDGAIQDVYVVSGFGLGAYNYAPYNPNGGINGGNLWTSSTSYKNGWVNTYASNEGVTEDFSQGRKVYANVKSYVTYAEMVADENDYSSFDSRYWDCGYGVPLWKSSLDAACEIAVVTKASVTSEHFTLRLGKVETAQFVFGPFGAPMAGVRLDYEVFDGDGFDATVISVADDLTVTAKKAGKAKIKVSCTYQGTYYEKIMRITVKESVPSSSETDSGEAPQAPAATDGCSGTVGGLGGGLVALLGLAIYKKEKRKNAD